MQFQPLVPNVEILGLAVELTVKSFRILPSIMLRYFIKHGVLQNKDDRIDPQRWYSQAAWLKVFADVYNQVGPNVTTEMGRHIGALHPLPDTVNTIEASLRFMDIGYHSSHRLRGQVMYDQTTGKFIEGIGHYAFQPGAHRHEAYMRSDNPYPCDFDVGLIEAVVKRHEPRARVEHVPGDCRKTGSEFCTYQVQW